MKVELKLGPPGTGKTTDLLNEVSELIRGGLPSTQIAYLAFTKKAATEAKERAMARFAIKEAELPWFRTIHSLAFKQIGAKPGRLLKQEHYAEVAKRCGFHYRGAKFVEDDEFSLGPADGMFFVENLARVTERTLEDVFEEKSAERVDVLGGDAYYLDDLVELRRQLALYKEDVGLLDFTDALETFVNSGLPPAVDVLIVDEAQDLSRLQWEAVDRVARTAKRVIVAGDDDQAIFRWAGADVDRFLALQGTVRVLNQSYRIPKSVHRIANGIISNVSARRPKQFAAREFEGVVEALPSVDQVDADSGQWLFLARHGFQVKQLEKECRERGWFYSARGERSNGSPAALAIMAWESLRKGLPARASDFAHALRLAGLEPQGTLADAAPQDVVTSSDFPDCDLSKSWVDALKLMPGGEFEYFFQAHRRGEKMATKTERGYEPVEPRVKISTIHGAKGGEADNVLLLTDISQSTYEAMAVDGPLRDDEFRVFYVGVTRTKERLQYVQTDCNANFELEE